MQWTSTPGPGQPVDFPASLAMQKEGETMVNSQPGWSSVCRTESKQGQAVARCGGFQVHWQFLGYRDSKQLTHVPAFHRETWMPKESHQAMVLMSILVAGIMLATSPKLLRKIHWSGQQRPRSVQLCLLKQMQKPMDPPLYSVLLLD